MGPRDSRAFSSTPRSLDDLGRVPSALCASVSSAVKWGWHHRPLGVVVESKREQACMRRGLKSELTQGLPL